MEKLVKQGFPKDQSIEFVEAVFDFVKEPDEFEYKAELDERKLIKSNTQAAAAAVDSEKTTAITDSLK